MTWQGAIAILLGTILAGLPIVIARTKTPRCRVLQWQWLWLIVGCLLMVAVAGMEIGGIAAISTVIAVLSLRSNHR